MKAQVEWILIADETRARVVRGLPAPGTAARPELVLRAKSQKLRDIMADKPGRSFFSGSAGRRSAMEYGSDPLRHDAISFALEIYTLIEAHRQAGEFDRLAIVATPHMLGLLRQEMPDALRPLVSHEIARNLAGIVETELPDVLRRELRRG